MLRTTLARLLDKGLAPFDTSYEPCAVAPNDHEFFWGMRNLPLKEALQHLLVLGTTGSGKTTLIQLYLQSIAHRFKSDRSPEQLIIYDAKGTFIPLLASLGLHPNDENFWILNPVDERTAVWKIGEAAQEPGHSKHIAKILIPEQPGENTPFFSNNARNLIHTVIEGLNVTHGATWGFRDLINALDSKEHILKVSSHSPRGKRVVESILDDEKHADVHVSTVTSQIQSYEQVAALWHSAKAPKEFSIEEFLEKPGVLVLGFDAVLKDSLWPTNALLLKSLSDEILRREDTDLPRHYFVFDEFASMQNVAFIGNLLDMGRSKGASVLLGNLNISSMKKVYGEDRTEHLLGLCTYPMFLRAGGPPTAQWMERYVGKARYTETSHSESEGKVNTSYNTVERSPILAATFSSLPLPRKNGPFKVVSDIPIAGGIRVSQCPANEIFSMCKARRRDVPGLIRRKNRLDQYLQPWTPGEEALFCQTRDEEVPGVGAAEEENASISTEQTVRSETWDLPDVSKIAQDEAFPGELPDSFQKFLGPDTKKRKDEG